MEPNPEYAHIVTSWIPPEAWRAAARRLAEDRPAAVREWGVQVTLKSLPFRHWRALVRPLFEWLANFTVPPELLELVRRSPDAVADDAAWRWLAELAPREEYRLDPAGIGGQAIWTASPPKVSVTAGEQEGGTRVIILAPEAVLDLVRPAAMALGGMIGRQVALWSANLAKVEAAGGTHLFFETSHPGWFGTLVESWTAEELAGPDAVRSAWRSGPGGTNLGLGFVSAVLPRFPAEPVILEVARRQATALART
jgi:hypothetical protein